MPKAVKGLKYLLVVVDKFSKWTEAYSTRKEDAASVVKALVTDFFPRWGLPEAIDSDGGTHFTAKVIKGLSEALKIKWRIHVAYAPTSSGIVERKKTNN